MQVMKQEQNVEMFFFYCPFYKLVCYLYWGHAYVQHDKCIITGDLLLSMDWTCLKAFML